LAFVVLWTLQTDPQLHYTPRSAFSSLVSLSVSLVLCNAAAGGVEATALARLHHVALPLWAVSSRLRSCAAAVEAAVEAAVVAAGGAAVAVADEVLRAAVVGAAAVSPSLLFASSADNKPIVIYYELKFNWGKEALGESSINVRQAPT
jgi:hypothetical protein